MIENYFYSYVPTDWFDGSIQWIPTSFEWTSGPGTLWDGVLWLLKRSLDARCGSQTPPLSRLSSHFPMIIEAQTSMYPGEAAPLHSLVAGSMCGGRDIFFCVWNWCKSKVHLINIDTSAKSWIAMWKWKTLMGLWPRLLVGLMAHRSSAMWRLWDGEIVWDWFCCDRGKGWDLSVCACPPIVGQCFHSASDEFIWTTRGAHTHFSKQLCLPWQWGCCQVDSTSCQRDCNPVQPTKKHLPQIDLQ